MHDIEVLLDVARTGGIRLPREIREAGALSPYAVEARYPGYDEDITATDVDDAIRLADRVVAWATTLLKIRRDA